jgi:hypothetical protein
VVVGRARGHSPTPAEIQRLTLVESRVTTKGVTIRVFRSTGRLRYATAT